jgi:hypothetical protein
MAELNYTDLNINKVINTNSFKWNEKEVEIVDYISFEDKYDIVMITLQKSLENGIYNPMKLDMYFHLNLVYMYSNLVFSADDRADEPRLYDEMLSSGFMDEFLQHIDIKEYVEMQNLIEQISELKMKYDSSAASVIKKFVDDLPANAEAAKQILDSFDKEKYQNVMDFAKAANGGRPIK